MKILEKKARQIRKDILDISYQAYVGHIGSALSIVDLLTVLYYRVLRLDPKKPLNSRRDRFILSKGHAAAALYAVLCQKGFFSRKKLFTFCQDGGFFGVHPDYHPELGIEFTTGSLGHGLSVAVGLALGLKGKSRVFVLISDAELNEGSTWEAMMFAGHHQLDNLTVIVDDNGSQALGKTREILDLQPLASKWQAFGWQTKVVDGHDLQSLVAVFSKIPFQTSQPSVLIAKTVIGKGVSFMENNFEWHYWPMTKKLYQKALKEI